MDINIHLLEISVKITYEYASNALKIILPAASAVLLAIQNRDESYKIIAANAAIISVIFIVLISLFDRVRSDIMQSLRDLKVEIENLNSNVATNFEYHGLLDSPKDNFTAMEMKGIWPILVERVKREFFAINYLSREAWMAANGDGLCVILGSKVNSKNNVSAKRVFVVDSIEEIENWNNTASIHRDQGIGVRYILKENFDAIKKRCAKEIINSDNIRGFNIIDKDYPGIVVDWIYTDDRRTDGANLKRGPHMAHVYYSLFDEVWNDRDCKKFNV